MEKKYMVLSGMGPDHKGIARAISECAFKQGCSIEDSRMVKLGGEFAILVLVSGKSHRMDEFARLTPELERDTGLTIQLRETETGGVVCKENIIAYHIHVVGMDQLGVVFRVTNLLVRHQINIGSLETESHHAPVTGTPLFRMDLVAEVPAKVSVAHLRDELSQLCDDMNMDYSMEVINR